MVNAGNIMCASFVTKFYQSPEGSPGLSESSSKTHGSPRNHMHVISIEIALHSAFKSHVYASRICIIHPQSQFSLLGLDVRAKRRISNASNLIDARLVTKFGRQSPAPLRGFSEVSIPRRLRKLRCAIHRRKRKYKTNQHRNNYETTKIYNKRYCRNIKDPEEEQDI